MKTIVRGVAASAALLLTLTLAAGQANAKSKKASAKRGGWTVAKDKKFGFQMSVPKGTVLLGKDWKNGWGGLYGNYRGVQVWGLAQLGKQHRPAAFKLFGVLITGIPGKRWWKIDAGKNQQGFEWYETYRAVDKRRVVLCTFGVGKRGSYMLVLETSRKSYARDKAQYVRWYSSVRVF